MNNMNSVDVMDVMDDLVGDLDIQRPMIEPVRDTSDPVKFFRFLCNPFSDSVNPKFFFRTEAHEDAYVKMKRCIEDDISIGLTTAGAGTGKTLLTQILLGELEPGRYKAILALAYPRMSRTALLKEIINELGVEDVPKRSSIHTYLKIIQDKIIELYKIHKKIVIIIDEVHFLHADSLHIVRTLSNMEIPEKKLITILLFGEDSFLRRMNNPTYKSIFSRMFIRARLRALHPDEVEQYIKFRCLTAGGHGDMFTSDSYPVIYEYSEGVPRDVNRICYNIIALAAQQRLKTISAQFLRDSYDKI